MANGEEVCDNCRFSRKGRVRKHSGDPGREVTVEVLECHRFAPSPSFSRKERNACFPIVFRFNWCGEYWGVNNDEPTLAV